MTNEDTTTTETSTDDGTIIVGSLVAQAKDNGTLWRTTTTSDDTDTGTLAVINRTNPATGRPIGEDWLASLRNQHTRTAYRRDLRAFMQWCDGVGVDPLTAARGHIDTWVGDLSEREKPATVARRLVAVRNFYEYLIDADMVASNPTDRVKRPVVNHRNQNVTATRTPEELVAVRTVSEQRPRDHALVVVLMDTGLRISEALALDVGCLERDGGRFALIVHRKGGNLGRVLATPRVVEVIEALEMHLAETGRTSGPLFAQDNGKRWTHNNAQAALNRLARHAKIEPPLTPHQFRASGITHLLAKGVPLHRVQLWAGHADPATTQRYNAQREALDASPANDLMDVYS